MNRMNTFTLKWIAIITMFIDHMGAILFPTCEWMRIVGRLAFPIFAYLLVEGFMYTKDIHKYLKRLGIFAFISEIPFDMAFLGAIDFTHQNVFFELFAGLLMLYLMLKTPDRLKKVLIMIVTLLVTDWLCFDYGSWGILMILAFYEYRDKKALKLAALVIVNLLMGYTQVYAGLAAFPIGLHNRELGPRMKYFFYVFYPVHLLLLFIISCIV